MKVIWRQKGSGWEIATGHIYRDEAQLQAFLAENPILIPFEDISDQILHPKVMLREAGLPGSGSSDIVGVDEAGEITVIECKLATNPEVKRKVIGQVLEYAAYLWRQPYSFLDDLAQKRLQKSLAQAVFDALDEETRADWDESAFIQATANRLLSGEFRIIIAVDSMNDELRRTIEYLTQGPSRLEIFALELTFFTSGDREILVPQLHGATPAAPTGATGAPSYHWDAERFFSDAQEKGVSEEQLSVMKDLLGFCETEASRVFWGRGKGTGSFTFHYLHNDTAYSLFSVFSDARLQINFGWLREKLDTSLVQPYRDALLSIEGFSKISVRDDYKSWPALRIEKAFRGEADVDLFKSAVVAFRDSLRELE
jgi:hypothetical protein